MVHRIERRPSLSRVKLPAVLSGIALFLTLSLWPEPKLSVSAERRGNQPLPTAHLSPQQPASPPSQSKNEAETQSLEAGKPIERELAGGQTHAFRIALAADQFLNVVVEQRGIDVVAALFGPDGQKLVEVDSPNGAQGPEQVLAITQAAGNHRIEVRSTQKEAAAGRYEIKIVEARAAEAPDHKRLAAQKLSAEAAQLRKNPSAESLRLAIEKHKEARSLWQELNDPANEAQMLNNLGEIYYSLGQYQQSLDFFKQMLALCRAGQNCIWEAETLANLAFLYDTLGRKQEAIESYNRAIPLLRAQNNRGGLATTLSNLGLLHWSMGEHQQALENYDQALKLYRELNDRHGMAFVLNNMGAVHDSLED